MTAPRIYLGIPMLLTVLPLGLMRDIPALPEPLEASSQRDRDALNGLGPVRGVAS